MDRSIKPGADYEGFSQLHGPQYSGGGGFPVSLCEWSFITYPTPFNSKLNVLVVSLNKTFSTFLVYIYTQK